MPTLKAIWAIDQQPSRNIKVKINKQRLQQIIREELQNITETCGGEPEPCGACGDHAPSKMFIVYDESGKELMRSNAFNSSEEIEQLSAAEAVVAAHPLAGSYEIVPAPEEAEMGIQIGPQY